MNDMNKPDIQKLIARKLEELGLTRLSRMFSVEHNVPRGTHKTIVIGTGGNADTVDDKHASDLALAAHVHPESDVTNLVTDLAGKAAVNHGHALDDLIDVDAPTPDYEDVLAWDRVAGKWVPRPPAFTEVISALTDVDWATEYAQWAGPGVLVKFVVPVGATGAWAGHDTDYAEYISGVGWSFSYATSDDLVRAWYDLTGNPGGYFKYGGGVWFPVLGGSVEEAQNADTVDYKHASDFLEGIYDSAYGCLLVTK